MCPRPWSRSGAWRSDSKSAVHGSKMIPSTAHALESYRLSRDPQRTYTVGMRDAPSPRRGDSVRGRDQRIGDAANAVTLARDLRPGCPS